MQIEQPGPAKLREKKPKGSASTVVATERLEKRHKGNDIGMVDDIVTNNARAAKMAKTTEQD